MSIAKIAWREKSYLAQRKLLVVKKINEVKKPFGKKILVRGNFGEKTLWHKKSYWRGKSLKPQNQPQSQNPLQISFFRIGVFWLWHSCGERKCFDNDSRHNRKHCKAKP